MGETADTGQSASLNAARATRVTWEGIVVNLALMIFKFAAGFAGRSKAMIADAVESLADLPSNLVVLFGITMGNRPADRTHDYGHGKIETLATTAVGFLLIVAGFWIFGNGAFSIYRSLRGEILHRPGWLAFIGSIIVVITKEWLYRYTLKVGREVNSQAVIANAWHHRSDAYTSVGTLVGIGGAILLGPRMRILDPLAAVVVSVLIVRMGVAITRNGLNELIEASESDETEAEILRVISGVTGVHNPHRLRTRRIGNQTAIDVHVEVDGDFTVVQAHEVASQIESQIRNSFGQGTLVTVHIEPRGYREAR